MGEMKERGARVESKCKRNERGRGEKERGER